MATGTLTIIKGDDKTWAITVKDSSAVAIDITGWTIFFSVKSSRSDLDATAILTKAITSHTTPAIGLSSLVLDDTDTVNLLAGDYWYDLQFKSSTGLIMSSEAGIFSIDQDVTTKIT
jgi:hypothetical protein